MATELHVMHFEARRARQSARPLRSGFAVGAALKLSNGDVVRGANIEEAWDTRCGTCAERAAIAVANSQSGPLHPLGPVTVREVGLWMETPEPGWPCGLCRDAIFGVGPDAQIYSACPTGTAESSIRALLPLAPIPGEVDPWVRFEEFRALHPDEVRLNDELTPLEARVLRATDRGFSNAYTPRPFASGPPVLAAIWTAAMTQEPIAAGQWMEATTRLVDTPISRAVKTVLTDFFDAGSPGDIIVAVKNLGGDLPMISGADRQVLQELTGPRGDRKIRVVFGSGPSGLAAAIPLELLFPKPFGRADLGY